jgi:hypothetical protein
LREARDTFPRQRQHQVFLSPHGAFGDRTALCFDLAHMSLRLESRRPTGTGLVWVAKKRT